MNDEQQKAVEEAVSNPNPIARLERVTSIIEQSQRDLAAEKAVSEAYRQERNEAAEAFEQLAHNFPAIQTDCEGPVKAAQFINMVYERVKEGRDIAEKERNELQAAIQQAGKAYESMTDKYQESQAKLLAEQAAGAEMRELLIVINQQVFPGLGLPSKYIVWMSKALSTSHGKAMLEERERMHNALEFCETNNHADNNHGKISCRGHECRVCDVIREALKETK